MMKARSNQRAANRGNRLARAVLMCAPGSKICPPERATELLEAIIEPGDRVVIRLQSNLTNSNVPSSQLKDSQ
jgi:malonate decarboxylase alpha subunit